ncbi:MAG: hypothetical protein CMI60_22100 [Parvibaculum sp.]|nr:hypothetical protein [Parvibaculum sp.]
MCGGGGDGSSGAGDDMYGERTRSINNPDGTPNTTTYNYSDSTIGRFLGDNRSDQQVQDDSQGYSRDMVAPSRGGVLADLNAPPTVGGFAGFGASSLIGGPLGFVAGQAVRMGVNSLLGDRSVLGGR